MSEQVLALPVALLREVGIFQGFHAETEQQLARLCHSPGLCFLPRDEAENDPTFKQLIPYLVLRHRGEVFHYRRGGGGGEKRLAAQRSIGLGGHITSADGSPTQAYRAGLLRELAEEVEIGDYRERCIGLINDDRTPVGRVHLGIVHLLDLKSATVRCLEDSLAAGGFASLGELRQQIETFETWSQFLLEGAALEV
jgi:predicted NUDIX family phosphoesterase